MYFAFLRGIDRCTVRSLIFIYKICHQTYDAPMTISSDVDEKMKGSSRNRVFGEMPTDAAASMMLLWHSVRMRRPESAWVRTKSSMQLRPRTNMFHLRTVAAQAVFGFVIISRRISLISLSDIPTRTRIINDMSTLA